MAVLPSLRARGLPSWARAGGCSASGNGMVVHRVCCCEGRGQEPRPSAGAALLSDLGDAEPPACPTSAPDSPESLPRCQDPPTLRSGSGVPGPAAWGGAWPCLLGRRYQTRPSGRESSLPLPPWTGPAFPPARAGLSPQSNVSFCTWKTPWPEGQVGSRASGQGLPEPYLRARW